MLQVVLLVALNLWLLVILGVALAVALVALVRNSWLEVDRQVKALFEVQKHALDLLKMVLLARLPVNPVRHVVVRYRHCFASSLT